MLDDMGLGKSLEILSLVLANPLPSPQAPLEAIRQAGARVDARLAALREEASVGENEGELCTCGGKVGGGKGGFEGVWVQCASCQVWFHGVCVGFRARGGKIGGKKGGKKGEVVEDGGGEYQCDRCRDVIGSSEVEGSDVGTTLVVCPGTILPQWEAEVAKWGPHKPCF